MCYEKVFIQELKVEKDEKNQLFLKATFLEHFLKYKDEKSVTRLKKSRLTIGQCTLQKKLENAIYHWFREKRAQSWERAKKKVHAAGSHQRYNLTRTIH